MKKSWTKENCFTALYFAAFIYIVAGCTTTTPNPKASQPGEPAMIQAADTNSINAAISTVKGLIDASAPVNPYSVPLGLLASLIGGAVTLGSVTLAKVKNDKANTLGKIVTSVIQGVEQGTTGISVTADSVKSAIQAKATAAGVNDDLHAMVKSNT